MKMGGRIVAMGMGKSARRCLLFFTFFLAGAPFLASAQISPQPIGYFCDPNLDTPSIVDGQFYAPQSGMCTYLSPTIIGTRYGDIYRGTVGSSTILNGHLMGNTATSTQFGDNIPNPVQGEDIFAAIYPAFNLGVFRNYFQTGAGTPPHTNYGFIRFKWGTPPPPEPTTPDPVIIIPGILGSEKNSAGEWIIDPILHTYDDLIATLDANGYTPDVDLFPFPYNWRKSNVETAILLKQKIDAVKVICGCDKVDLVAHSMGGLVARQYIQSDDYDQDVDQLIFLGTPHLGAPKAYLMWEGGVTGYDWQDAPMNFLLSQEAEEEGYSDVFTYIQEKPISSVQQLLPVYDYIFDSAGLRNYPSNYPTNVFLESLNNAVNDLNNSGVRLYNLVGNTSNLETIVGLNTINDDARLPKWEHGFPDEENIPFVFGTGDGTVATPSASFVNSNLTLKDSGHRMLPTVAEGDVFEILTGEIPSVLVNNPDILNLKLIIIKILSPADLLVVAPDGRKIGKDFSTGQEVNEIPNAFYTGFTTNTEYITILNPIEGEYKVFNQGTGGGGQYTIEMNYISEATTTEASFTGNTTHGLITELNIPVDNENPALEILPSDVQPPTITITSPEAKDYLRSEQMSVNVSAQDASGVFALETKLGTTTIQNTGTIDLFFLLLGTHSVFASSTDNVGNATSSARTFRVIADATSTLSDIQRAYTLGWVTKKISDDLTKKLKACNVKKTTITTVTKMIVVTGKNGKPTTKKIQEKVEKVEIVFDKNCAKAILKDLDKYRNKGLDEQAYLLLREDIEWITTN